MLMCSSDERQYASAGGRSYVAFYFHLVTSRRAK